MAGFIYEFFGFSADDNSHASRLAVAQRNCPFLNSACVKRFHDGEPAGVCAVRQKSKGAPPIICCPNRLYADRYKVLYDITKDAFGKNFKLYAGRSAVEKAKIEKGAVAVFGHGWGGELRLPKRKGTGSYFVCPRPVYDRVLSRLGGLENLPAFPAQPASIHFIAYDYASCKGRVTAQKPLAILETHSTTVYKIQEAFSSLVLPTGNVYRDAIVKSLYE